MFEKLSFKVRCKPLTLVNGAVTYNTSLVGNGYLAPTTASFSCNVGYLSESLSRTCQLSGQWSETNPTCIPGDEMSKFNYLAFHM